MAQTNGAHVCYDFDPFFSKFYCHPIANWLTGRPSPASQSLIRLQHTINIPFYSYLNGCRIGSSVVFIVTNEEINDIDDETHTHTQTDTERRTHRQTQSEKSYPCCCCRRSRLPVDALLPRLRSFVWIINKQLTRVWYWIRSSIEFHVPFHSHHRRLIGTVLSQSLRTSCIVATIRNHNIELNRFGWYCSCD